VHGAHAAGDLDAQLAHPDDLFCLLVAVRNPQVCREPEIVIGPGRHPGAQSVALLLLLAAAGISRAGVGAGRADCSAGLRILAVNSDPEQARRLLEPEAQAREPFVIHILSSHHE
jgi:hypothetical protein